MPRTPDPGGGLARLWRWSASRDRDHLALRRAGRAAIVMPVLFVLGAQVVGNADVATFAAFGSIALLLLMEVTGTIRDRLRTCAAVVLVGAVNVVLGTVVSGHVWLAVPAMVVVGFVVIFAGVVSSVLAGVTTSLLLSFILPVSIAAPLSAIPYRLAGWGVAGVFALVAVGLLWPAPVREPLRNSAAAAARALASRLRTEVAVLLSPADDALMRDYVAAVERAEQQVRALRQGFVATPYRPSGLSTAARGVVRLIDELQWLSTIVSQQDPPVADEADRAACRVRTRAATVLERGAAVLDGSTTGVQDLRTAVAELTAATERLETRAMLELPVQHRSGETGVGEFVTALTPSFRAHELAFAVGLVAANVDLAASAEQAGWWARLLGHAPGDPSGPFAAARERASSHLEWHSVWMHNSVRGALGLGLAVLVASLAGVEHSFWVVLGALSVLRSNALNTGQNALRALLGTVVGVIIGAGLLFLVGTDVRVLYVLLPVAVLVAGVAPAVISFTAGQAAFTLTLVILYNIIQPAGWRVGLLRVEDIALGCAVSLVVGLLFWPRGAAAALRRALAEAYTDSAAYLGATVEFGVARCDASVEPAEPSVDAARAAAASRRLDDTFRTYLAERGAKTVPLAEATSLVTGVAGVRLAADAVLELWRRDDGTEDGDRTTARTELVGNAERLRRWYDELGANLVAGRQPGPPLDHDTQADGRLIAALRRDLSESDGSITSSAVRIVWTSDYLDAVRRMQATIVESVPSGVPTRGRDRVRA